MISLSAEFAEGLKHDIAHWKAELAAANTSGCHGMAESFCSWIAEGERLIIELQRLSPDEVSAASSTVA